MIKTIVTACAIALAAAAAPVAVAQAQDASELVALQQSAKKDKRALVAQTLALTLAEAKKFWPMYDNYQRDLTQLNRQRNLALETLAAREKPLTDAYAKQVVNDLVAVEEQEVKALRKMTGAAMRALPPKKAARYIQLENKLRAAQDYEIAVAFPLAQ